MQVGPGQAAGQAELTQDVEKKKHLPHHLQPGAEDQRCIGSVGQSA